MNINHIELQERRRVFTTLTPALMFSGRHPELSKIETVSHHAPARVLSEGFSEYLRAMSLRHITEDLNGIRELGVI